MGDEIKDNQKQDVQIAVMAQEMKHFGERIESLTDVVKRFIDISDKKLDRETYLADRKTSYDEMKSMSLRLAALEDFQKGVEYGEKGKENEQRKIWGMSTGTIGLIINLLTLVTLAAAVFQLFT